MHRFPRALTLRQQRPLFQNFLGAPFHHQQQRARWSLFRRRAPLEQQPMRTQTVRFQKPVFTRKRVMTTLVYTFVIAMCLRSIWRVMDIEVEFIDADELEEEEEMTEEEMQEMEEEDDIFDAEEGSTFIPLTWARKQPRTWYKGSDPEWQEFVKISKDNKRRQKIIHELVQLVATGSLQHPAIAKQLGKDAKAGKWWLDISFPEGPPQEYMRSGIEIGDGFVAWSQQTIEEEHQWKLTRALWPTAVGSSAWASVKVLAGMQWRKMKQAFGWEGRDPLSPEERFRNALEVVAKQQQARGKQMGEAQTSPNGSASNAVMGSSSEAEATRDTASKDDQARLPYTFNVPLPSSSALTPSSNDLPIAMHVFASNLTKQWNPKKMEPPRGSFMVQGMVEVRGQTGRILFDVQSAYDPHERKFVHVNAGVRVYKRWKQTPRGGN